MLLIESVIEANDNAGGIKFTIITIFGGFRRRYARLGELVGVVSKTRKTYKLQTNKQKLAKLAKKVKKKRKIKARKKRQPNMRPYLGLLVAVCKNTNRYNGSYIRFLENRMVTYTEPTKFGPAGKTENIPNFIGTRMEGPVPFEITTTPTLQHRFGGTARRAGVVV
jgi:ribosomal protein L14